MLERSSNASVPDIGTGWGLDGRGVWAGVVVVTGGALGSFQGVHVLRMLALVGPSGALLEAVLPMALSGVLAGVGAWLYRTGYGAWELRRVVGWMVVGATGVGVLFAWSLSHHYVAGGTFAHAGFVMGSNLVVGALFGTVVGLYDVRTRRHRREAEAERAAADRERTKLAFLNRELRHHVLNGVNVVKGRIEEAEEGTVDPAAVQADIDEVVEVVERIGRISRAFDPAAAPSLEPRDLSATVRREADRLATASEATVETDLADDVTVLADDLLESAVENLLSNAVEHSDRERPWVRVELAADGGRATLRVADDGPGVDPATRRAVTDWTAAPVDSTSPAVGVGFALVGAAVDRYGGTVAIEDRDPRGTVVTLELPLAGADG